MEPGGNVAKTDTVIALILVDSSTNYTGCVPIRGKNDFDVMVREIIQFTHVLGHSECTYLCDNQPAIKEVQKRAVRARKSMGFVTRDKTLAAYTHGNSLCENTVGRVRGLAGTFMHHVQEKLSMKLNTNHGLWSWALRHAIWLSNSFAVVNGSTPFELVYQKVYKGRMTEFAEPAFAYTHTALKGNPKWQRVIVLGENRVPRYICGFHWSYSHAQTLSAQSVNRLEVPLRVLPSLQCTNVEVQDWFWWQSCANKESC